MSNAIKKCQVCGDHATGFNYCGLSCESCKVFFCRNSAKQLKCTHNDGEVGACQIDKANRTECPKCRLDKCFAIGMIRSGRVFSNSKFKKKNDFANSSKIDKILEISILKNYSRSDHKEMKSYILGAQSTEIVKRQCSPKLNQYELERIVEAQQAIRVFGEENQAEIVGKLSEMDDMMELYSPSEIYIKKTIQFCHNIPAFNQLNSQDQLAVFKPFCFDALAIRFSFLFDPEKQCVPLIVDESGEKAILIDIGFGESIINQQVMLQNIQYSVWLKDILENDVKIRDLLSAILLFKCHDKILNPEIFRYHFVLYCRLLLRYLEHKHENVKNVKKKFNILMSVIDALSVMKENEKILVKEIAPHKLPHVFVELLDMT